ncbi:N-acetylglucosamine-6-phosphate deacetylase [Nakamurella lactea]|uniref:N-acetylglucosamine-6-phosphate deacetylase n=1 Tax=Nakamurella lactea TaxID=459515 RepID=UPI000421C404|nr:amidohydrolase family protein [Nakamurella lactea]
MDQFLEGRTIAGRAIRVRYDTAGIADITEIGSTAVGRRPGLLLTPGLIDLQLNGFAGIDVNAPTGPLDLIELVRRLWDRGVTTVFPTIISAERSQTRSSIARLVAAIDRDPLVAAAVPGLHLEGPYLSDQDGYRGAHSAPLLRDPDIDEFDQWQRTANGLIAIMTLAPERTGALEFTRHLADNGVLASIGHSAATAEQVHAFVAAGGRLSTHLGNGIPSVIDRHRNPIWPQLVDDALTAGLIADGHHLPADAFLGLVRAKGIERCVLTSDAAALAGCPPGDYTTPVGGAVTVASDGSLRLAGTPYLAGSGASLLDCVRWASRTIGPAAAVTMATANPARLLGLTDRGRLQVGARADLVQFAPAADGGPGEVVTVVVGGTVRVKDGART